MVSRSNMVSPQLRAVECGAPGEIFHNIDCKGYAEIYHTYYSHTVKLSRTEHYCNATIHPLGQLTTGLYEWLNTRLNLCHARNPGHITRGARSLANHGVESYYLDYSLA